MTCLNYKSLKLASLRPTTKEVYATFVSLSDCLCARLLKNAWMDLDEILRVDMDELINF